MPTLFMHVHLVGLVVVELLPDGRLVLGRQPRPRLVGAPVVLVARRHLDVVVELDDLPALELVDRRAEAQFPEQVPLLLLAFTFEFLRRVFWREEERKLIS